MNPEEIFLFTLFGSSQPIISGRRGSFTAPLVSDPTNPNATAAPLEQAVARYHREQNRSSRTRRTLTQPDNATTTSSTASLVEGQPSSLSDLWMRMRQRVFDTDETITTTPSRSTSWFRQLFHWRPQHPLIDNNQSAMFGGAIAWMFPHQSSRGHTVDYVGLDAVPSSPSLSVQNSETSSVTSSVDLEMNMGVSGTPVNSVDFKILALPLFTMIFVFAVIVLNEIGMLDSPKVGIVMLLLMVAVGVISMTCMKQHRRMSRLRG